MRFVPLGGNISVHFRLCKNDFMLVKDKKETAKLMFQLTKISFIPNIMELTTTGHQQVSRQLGSSGLILPFRGWCDTLLSRTCMYSLTFRLRNACSVCSRTTAGLQFCTHQSPPDTSPHLLLLRVRATNGWQCSPKPLRVWSVQHVFLRTHRQREEVSTFD